MSHAGHSHTDPMEAQGVGGPTGTTEDSLLSSIPAARQNELLEMLHVPLLHGGVREVLLLAPFTTTSTASFTVACLLLVLVTWLLEMLRVLQWWVEGRYTKVKKGHSSPVLLCDCKQCTHVNTSSEHQGYNTMPNHHNHHQPDSIPPSNSTTPLTAPTQPYSNTLRHACLACAGVIQLLIYLLATLLMLIAMTMNVYLILSMGIGSAIGKLMALVIKKRYMDLGGSGN